MSLQCSIIYDRMCLRDSLGNITYTYTYTHIRVVFRGGGGGAKGGICPPPPPNFQIRVYICIRPDTDIIIHVMQGQKCTKIDLRACLFSKISWGSMPPDPPSLLCAYGTQISPAPSKLLCSHICPPPPFPQFSKLNPAYTCTCIYQCTMAADSVCTCIYIWYTVCIQQSLQLDLTVNVLKFL